MIRLSASSIRDFLHCSQMFYFRRNNPEESIDTQESVVGRIIHEVIEKEWKDEASGFSFSNRLANECAIDGLGVEKINKCLTTFYSGIQDITSRLRENDKIEFNFHEQLNSEVALSGKMDRVIVDDGIVIDWKTGRTKNYLSNDVQFIIYYMMYKKIFGGYPRSVLQVNLSTAKVTSFQPNKEYINTLFNAIIPMIVERVRKNKIYKEGYFNGACYNCNFIGVCSKDT